MSSEFVSNNELSCLSQAAQQVIEAMLNFDKDGDSVDIISTQTGIPQNEVINALREADQHGWTESTKAHQHRLKPDVHIRFLEAKYPHPPTRPSDVIRKLRELRG